MYRKSLVIYFVLLAFGMSSCGVYSLKSGSIPLEVKTISIDNIYNESSGGPANITLTFAEKIRNYYQQNSRLEIIKSNGDWQLEPKIVVYNITPVAAQLGNNTQSSALNRLTIALQVKFVNTLDEKANFDQKFSFFKDYEKDKSLSQVESELVDEISNQIVIDIFNKTTSNW